MNRRRADLALAFNTVIWGSTFVLVKAALTWISPILFIALRFLVAGTALLAYFGLRRKIVWNPRTALAGALAGVFLFGGYALQTLGLRTTSAPKSAFLTGLTSVMVPLLASCVYRSRPRVSELVGVAVATIGLALMTLEGTIGPINRGDLLTLCCTVSFAAHIVTLGHFAGRMGFELLSLAQTICAAVLGLTLFPLVEYPRIEWQPIVLWAIPLTGLLATALAFTLQAWAQRYVTSTRTALIYMLEPVVALITSLVLIGEGLSGRAAAGAALILGGVALVEVKPLNAREHH